jgi:hypothetical protein
MPQEQQQNQRQGLPNHALEAILAQLPLQQRLGNCSLASRSLREAAAAATRSIQLHDIDSQQQADAVCAWLRRHGSKGLQHLDLAGEQDPEFPAAVNLPWQKLLQLRSLSVQRVELPLVVSSSQTASLAALTRLTDLQLGMFSSSSTPAVIRWVTRQIRSLTALRILDLDFTSFGQVERSSGALDATLAAAVGQLVQLTSLTLGSNLHGTALAAASSLSELQRLQLIGVGSSEHPIAARDLPSSLTHLKLLGCTCASGSWQLPALQDLNIWDVAGFDAAALAGLQQLSSLTLGGEDCTPLDMESFLAQLPKLQQLQHLELHDVQDEASAASYGALTSSSQLTALRMIDCSIPYGAAQHMFAAGRQLQQLQHLEVNASDAVHCQYALGTVERRVMQSHSLVLGPGNLQRLVTCCPRLTQLALIWPDNNASSAADDLGLLLQLTGLTGLTIGGAHVDTLAARHVLKHLTGEHGYYLTAFKLLHLRNLMSFALMHGLHCRRCVL